MTDVASIGKTALLSILQSLREYGNLSKKKNACLKHFDMKVCPMLLHGCELWGLNPIECIDTIQYYACKRFIKVPLKTSNFGFLESVADIRCT